MRFSANIVPQIVVDLRNVTPEDYITPKHCKRARAHWVMKDGTKIRIRDMSDTHLQNTLEYFSRKLYTEQQNMSYPCFQGEMAQDAAEAEWSYWNSASLEEVNILFEILSEEAYTRGVEWRRYA